MIERKREKEIDREREREREIETAKTNGWCSVFTYCSHGVVFGCLPPYLGRFIETKEKEQMRQTYESQSIRITYS